MNVKIAQIRWVGDTFPLLLAASFSWDTPITGCNLEVVIITN